MQNKNDCRICRLIRFYLLFSVPLLAAIGVASSAPGENHSLIWLVARVELIDALAYGSALSLLIVLLYKGYKEFWVPSRREKALAKLTDRYSGTSDEL